MEQKIRRLKRAWRRRKQRVRRKIQGTADRPRLSVFRSSKQIYAQLIDDTAHRTLVQASSLSLEVAKNPKEKKTKVEIGKTVGLALARKATDKGIKKAVFDRGHYLYHGRVKALAQGAREGGLEF